MSTIEKPKIPPLEVMPESLYRFTTRQVIRMLVAENRKLRRGKQPRISLTINPNWRR